MVSHFSRRWFVLLCCSGMALAPASSPADELVAPIHVATPIQAVPASLTPPKSHPSQITPTPLAEPLTATGGQLQSLSLRVSPSPGLVPEVPPLSSVSSTPTLAHGSGGDRGHAGIDVQWAPTELEHRPLLFEDVALERQGRHAGLLQPLASSAHFFGRVPILPYLRGDEPTNTRVSPLGAPRPGSPGYPVTWPSLQPSLRGSLYQAGATVGGVFIVP